MSRNLTADLAADLRTRIVDGVIQPGDKLPSENSLMGEFGVSRTVVRSALTRLQAEGLVETERGLGLAPHFAMEIHLHLAAAYPREPWVEHFDWLDPLFNERLETKDGRMIVPDRPGLGITLSDQARAWTTESVEFGK